MIYIVQLNPGKILAEKELALTNFNDITRLSQPEPLSANKYDSRYALLAFTVLLAAVSLYKYDKENKYAISFWLPTIGTIGLVIMLAIKLYIEEKNLPQSSYVKGFHLSQISGTEILGCVDEKEADLIRYDQNKNLLNSPYLLEVILQENPGYFNDLKIDHEFVTKRANYFSLNVARHTVTKNATLVFIKSNKPKQEVFSKGLAGDSLMGYTNLSAAYEDLDYIKEQLIGKQANTQWQPPAITSI